jgi:putative addiction module component (TIGR02574 family)
MQAEFNEILRAALRLPESERLVLVDRLMSTLPEAPNGLSLDDERLLEELDRRDADREGAVPWEQLRDET